MFGILQPINYTQIFRHLRFWNKHRQALPVAAVHRLHNVIR
nr:MAG TPA: hypothetical protein [Caudoviricetes sp.]